MPNIVLIMANKFAGQMSDGAGSDICDFSPHRQKPGTDGTKNIDYEAVYDGAGRRIYFVNSVEEG
jgi:hypothetical protein